MQQRYRLWLVQCMPIVRRQGQSGCKVTVAKYAESVRQHIVTGSCSRQRIVCDEEVLLTLHFWLDHAGHDCSQRKL